MKNLKQLQLLGEVHYLILSNKQGSISFLSRHLGISRACLYKYIGELKLLGAKVKYSRRRRHFFYLEEFRLKISIQTDQLTQIYGGKSFFIPSSVFRLKNSIFTKSSC